MSDACHFIQGENIVNHRAQWLHPRVGLFVGLAAACVSLAACGSDLPTSVRSSDTVPATTEAIRESVPQGDLSRAAELALGTLKLEDTDLAVTREQSSQLAFLWQAYGSLSRSDTAATQELEALVQQIERAMSAEQLQAIRDMGLNRQVMMAWVEENGAGPEAAGSTDGARAGLGFGPPPGLEGGPGGGGPPAGGPPGGGGMMMGSGTGEGTGAESLTPEMQATLRAQRPATGPGDRVVLMLLQPLIDILKARAGA
jgi:hypothetical protein